MTAKLTSPLRWKRHGTGKDTVWEAETTFGSYYVRRDWSNGTQLVVRWCFTEYYDEGVEPVASHDAGKQWAQRDWDKRVAPALKAAKLGRALALLELTARNHDFSHHDDEGLAREWDLGNRMIEDLIAVRKFLRSVGRPVSQ